MSPLLLKALLVLVGLGSVLRKGYVRRRPFWGRRAWLSFATLLAAAIGCFLIGMIMALGVDSGIYVGMSPLAHRLYFVTLMTLVVGSPVLTVGLIIWLANGNPERTLRAADASADRRVGDVPAHARSPLESVRALPQSAARRAGSTVKSSASVPYVPMTPSELVAARTWLGLSPDQLAGSLGLPPAVINAWESGRDGIPAHRAKSLRWRAAIAERQAALAASGLPACEWMAAVEAKPEPATLEAQTAQLEQIMAHEGTCSICATREQFIDERFPPMPPRPISAGWRALGWVFQRAELLPRWAQPAVPMALSFGAYSLLKIVFLLHQIASDLRLALLALGGLSLSMLLGAVLGIGYGLFRMWREQLSSRGVAQRS